MSAKTGSKARRGKQLRGGLYLDSSALAKLYVPEPDSAVLERVLVGRRDLWVSDLAVTEVVSAAARRAREGDIDQQAVSRLHAALLDDLSDNSYLHAELSSAVHREAERLLVCFPGKFLRAADALHLALALSVNARTLVTFDRRLAEGVQVAGLNTFPLA